MLDSEWPLGYASFMVGAVQYGLRDSETSRGAGAARRAAEAYFLSVLALQLALVSICGTASAVDQTHVIDRWVVDGDPGDGESYGLIDREGRLVVPCQFDGYRFRSAEEGYLPDGLCVVSRDKKWGAIDRDDREVIPFQYEDMTSFCTGVAGFKQGGKWGILSKAGQIVLAPRFTKLDPFSTSGATPFTEGQETWGIVRRDGHILCEAKYQDAYALDDGMIKLQKDDKWGYADSSGKLLTGFIFDEAYGFSDGLAPVRKGDKWDYIDKQGKLLGDFRFDQNYSFSKGAAIVKVGNKQGLLSPHNEWLLKPEYKSVDVVHEFPNCRIFKFSNGYGVLEGFASSTAGRLTPENTVEASYWISKKYNDPTLLRDVCFNTDESRAATNNITWADDRNPRRGVEIHASIDSTGYFRLKPPPREVWERETCINQFAAGRGRPAAKFIRDDRIGYVTRWGREILPPVFDSAGAFDGKEHANGGRAVGKIGKTFWIVNAEGEILHREIGVDSMFCNAGTERLVVCFSEGGGCGAFAVVDREKVQLMPAEYAELRLAANGFMVAMKDGEWALFSPSGRRLTEFQEAKDEDPILLIAPGLAALNGKHQIYVYDENGSNVLKCSEIDDIWDEPDWEDVRLICFRSGDKWGCIDSNGKLIEEPVYDKLSCWGSVGRSDVVEGERDGRDWLIHSGGKRFGFARGEAFAEVIGDRSFWKSGLIKKVLVTEGNESPQSVLLDFSGRLLTPPGCYRVVFEEGEAFDGAIVVGDLMNQKWGIAGKNGFSLPMDAEPLRKPEKPWDQMKQFDQVMFLKNKGTLWLQVGELFLAKRGDEYLWINRDGKVVWERATRSE